MGKKRIIVLTDVQKKELEKGYKTGETHVLNRLGYTLKKVRKRLPLKRIEQTDVIFNNVAIHRKTKSSGTLQLSLDVKDNVRVGALSRKGYHRNPKEVCAFDTDQHWEETLVPFGILDIESAQTTVILGNSKLSCVHKRRFLKESRA
jgi:hypothetical protein